VGNRGYFKFGMWVDRASPNLRMTVHSQIDHGHIMLPVWNFGYHTSYLWNGWRCSGCVKH